jgi:hypothetical protein
MRGELNGYVLVPRLVEAELVDREQAALRDGERDGEGGAPLDRSCPPRLIRSEPVRVGRRPQASPGPRSSGSGAGHKLSLTISSLSLSKTKQIPKSSLVRCRVVPHRVLAALEEVEVVRRRGAQVARVQALAVRLHGARERCSLSALSKFHRFAYGSWCSSGAEGPAVEDIAAAPGGRSSSSGGGGGSSGRLPRGQQLAQVQHVEKDARGPLGTVDRVALLLGGAARAPWPPTQAAPRPGSSGCSRSTRTRQGRPRGGPRAPARAATRRRARRGPSGCSGNTRRGAAAAPPSPPRPGAPRCAGSGL